MAGIPESAEQRAAQSLAYKAMETPDLKRAAELCTEAIELDPRCVDALVFLSRYMAGDEERLAELLRVVRIAAEDLGGDSYFDENRGHFWGLVETRPYMRARTELAMSLAEADRPFEAIREFLALLDLNPGDNQGLRYLVMKQYLETGNAAGISGLLDCYAGCECATFAWSAVFERFMAGDMAGAEKALHHARRINPHVEDYLLGRKDLPEELPSAIGFGDEDEALSCMGIIGLAWFDNADAMDWLRRQCTGPEPVRRMKVGRNDPCPCGSGLKYKKCCLRPEVVRQPPGSSSVTGEIALREISRELKESGAESEEEVQELITKVNRRLNETTLDDFAGLSPSQMHMLLHNPFDSPGFIEFPPVLDTEPAGQFAQLFLQLAAAIGPAGLKATAKGYLPRRAVQSIAQACMSADEYAASAGGSGFQRELHYPELHRARIVAGLAGLISLENGKFILTARYHELSPGGTMTALYPLLLRTYCEKYCWSAIECNDQLNDLIQSSFAFTLYLLDKYGGRWRTNSFYEDAFLRAFPMAVDASGGSSYDFREYMVRLSYTIWSLHMFVCFMGLVEFDRTVSLIDNATFRLKKTPLLGAVVRFHAQQGCTGKA